jgi:hypothetical protein
MKLDEKIGTILKEHDDHEIVLSSTYFNDYSLKEVEAMIEKYRSEGVQVEKSEDGWGGYVFRRN